MTIETSVFTVLSPLALGRCFAGVVDQGASLPHIVFLRVSSVPENMLIGGAPPMSQIRLQVDVYGATYKEAKALAESVKTAMQVAQTTFANWLISDSDLYEAEVDQHRVTMDFGLWG